MENPTDDQNHEDPGVASALVESIHYSAKTYRMAIIFGQCCGAIAFLSGLLLILLGIAGQIEWIVEAGGLKSRLANASPGALFGVIGLFVLWRYKPIIQDDFSVRRGIHTSPRRRNQPAVPEWLLNVERPRNSKGDDIHYRGKK